MSFYADLSVSMKWTPREIDEQDLETIFDYVVAANKEPGTNGLYIDQIGL